MNRRVYFAFCALLTLLATAAWGQTAPAFTGTVIFGDSLSDDGNFADTTASKYGIRFPSPLFNYDDGRFTDGPATNPPAHNFSGVWTEQLSKLFLNLPVAKPSLEGGTDFAYGSATTEDGTQVVTQGVLSVTIENMGQQVSDYLSRTTPVDPNALHIVWGGANDLERDSSDANVMAAAAREVALVERLANAGARYVLVPNLPPLGSVPSYAGQPAIGAASAKFRDMLNADLDAMQVRLAAANVTLHLYRFDVYSLYMTLAANPAAYGFSDVMHAAQGQSGVNPDTYLFWDGLHPTTAGHNQLAANAYSVLKAPASVPGGAPVIRGVVNDANFSGAIASGTWISIFGTNLAPSAQVWGASDFVNGQLPTSLGGVSVMIDGKAAYVYYVSPTQLNVLAPADSATGVVSVSVTTAVGTATVQAIKASASPAFFQFSPASSKYIAALNQDNSYSGPVGLFGAAVTTRPAKPGEVIQLYATGLGPTSPMYPDGQLLTMAYPLPALPQVTVGGQTAVVQYAGLVSPGLYQVNVVVPQLPDGDYSVVVDLGRGSRVVGERFVHSDRALTVRAETVAPRVIWPVAAEASACKNRKVRC